MTTSLSLASSALPTSFVSLSEIVQVPSERWFDTVVLNIVFGARVGSSGRFSRSSINRWLTLAIALLMFGHDCRNCCC